MGYQVDLQQVKDLYYGEELSVPKVAERMGLPGHIVYLEMKKYGLPRRTKSEAQQLRVWGHRSSVPTSEIERLYFDEEKTLVETAEILSLSYGCVRTRLLEAGHQLRSRKEARLLCKGGRASVEFDVEEKHWIRKYYCDDGCSLATIGLRFSVSGPKIRQVLVDMGIKIRTLSEAQQLRRENMKRRFQEHIPDPVEVQPVLDESEVSSALVVQLRNESNLKIDEIAARCSLTNMEVYAILEQAGCVPVVS